MHSQVENKIGIYLFWFQFDAETASTLFFARRIPNDIFQSNKAFSIWIDFLNLQGLFGIIICHTHPLRVINS